MKLSKILISLKIIFVFNLLISFAGCDEISKIGQDSPEDVDYPSRDEIVQYRVSYTNTGTKDLVIDLMEGKVTFAYDYRGTGYFNAELFDGDRNKLLTIANNVQGPARNTVSYNVPSTAGYVLRVSGEGEWRIEHR